MKDLEGQVWDALRGIRYPGMSRDIVSFGFVKKVELDGAAAAVVLEMSTHNPEAAEATRRAAEAALEALPGIAKVTVRLDVNEPPNATRPKRRSPPTRCCCPRSRR